MQIVADIAQCEGLGMCEAMAPDIFEVGPEGHVVIHDPSPDESRRQDLQAAVDSCPVLALTLQD
ncbi:ferredoxin [Flexivirga meconopsidis]|uniref:ferredoxin n=1 Tax=Flexivirga meconopsidis TaxID=2977121 RepID=UPI002240B5BF|nr:ferredoxin [Flexivirga meconopsidis]